jgi:hypothetical protein
MGTRLAACGANKRTERSAVSESHGSAALARGARLRKGGKCGEEGNGVEGEGEREEEGGEGDGEREEEESEGEGEREEEEDEPDA